MLSKSKYCLGVQCNKILWLNKNKPDEKEEIDNESVFDNGHLVGDLAKKLLGDYKEVEFNDNLEYMINDTKKYLEEDNIIIAEASFKFDNNFCSVDLLKKEDNKYEIYEVKSSTNISNIYYDDISYQYYILNNLGLNISKTYIVHIDSTYERDGELDINKLFKINDVTDVVLSKQSEVKDKISEINEYMKLKDEPKKDLSINCMTPYECPYFKYCTKDLEENNVFDIASMRSSTKFKLYNEGLKTFNDLLNVDLDDKYKEQIEFEINDLEPKILKEKLKEFLNTLTYPLYLLDFETFQMPIPMYDKTKPYEQIPFQYSLHYIDELGNVSHKEFLSERGIDPRRTLAESLIKDIPMNKCVMAYNMSFEKTVIKKLAQLYPNLSEHLMNIYDNMKDLMIPFKNRDYYTKEMQGSYSIKYVLPALFKDDPSLNYHNLEMVHNGKEASNTFINMNELTIEEYKKARECLLKYCELDTYAMVKILDKIKEKIK